MPAEEPAKQSPPAKPTPAKPAPKPESVARSEGDPLSPDPGDLRAKLNETIDRLFAARGQVPAAEEAARRLGDLKIEIAQAREEALAILNDLVGPEDARRVMKAFAPSGGVLDDIILPLVLDQIFPKVIELARNWLENFLRRRSG